MPFSNLRFALRCSRQDYRIPPIKALFFAEGLLSGAPGDCLRTLVLTRPDAITQRPFLSFQIERDRDAHNDLRHRRSSVLCQFKSNPNPKREAPHDRTPDEE